jgi:hypothetical protein
VQLLGDHTILALASFSGNVVPSNAATFKKRKYKKQFQAGTTRN